MRTKEVTLSVPCYINQFYPKVGIAAFHLLEKLGYNVNVPINQRCCGQPVANSGYEHNASETYHAFVEEFKGNDLVLMPSGSCTLHVKKHYDTIPQTEEVVALRKNIHDMSQYIYNHHLEDLEFTSFPHKVALHIGCHSLRGMKFGEVSEYTKDPENYLKKLMHKVESVDVIRLDRPDECCGFGGTFAVTEEATSVAMGMDKIRDAESKGVEYIVSNDMSCILHLEGLIKRNKINIGVKHVLELLV